MQVRPIGPQELKSINKHRANSISMKTSPNGRFPSPGTGVGEPGAQLGSLTHLSASARWGGECILPSSLVPASPQQTSATLLNVHRVAGPGWGREDQGPLGRELGDGL